MQVSAMNSPVDSILVMPDVQSSLDTRHIPIQRVGIRGVRHPMMVLAADGTPQPTVGNWTLTVALPAEEKGTHMSRFIALLEKYRSVPMTPDLFRQMALEMLPLLHAQRGDLTVAFPYFVNKSAPVSGVQSLLDYEIQWVARAQGDSVEFELIAQVPVTSLCPLLEGDFGVRCAQPALARDRCRRTRWRGVARAPDPHRRGRGLLRTVGPAQAP